MIVDLHCDSVKFLEAGVDLRQPSPLSHVDLPRLEKGRVGVQTFAAFVAPSVLEAESYPTAVKMLDAIDRFAFSDPERLVSVETAADCRRTMAQGRIGVLRAVENGRAINGSLNNLEAFRKRGVRILTLVHSRHESWVASCTGKGGDPGGLTPFGKKVVETMNDLGIIVDVSHSAESTFWDVIKTSRRPIIASHSCCYSLCASPRNLKDEQIRALSDIGGVVGVCFFPAFLDDAYRQAMNERCGDIFEAISDMERKRGADRRRLLEDYVRLNHKIADRLSDLTVPLSRIVDHVDHIVQVAGEDCVAFGSDFDGISTLPEGVSGCDAYPLLLELLRKRGYTEQTLQKMRAGNFLRLLEAHDG